MAEQNLRHIVRVANVDLPGHKHLWVAMTKITGVGDTFAQAVCKVASIPMDMKAGALTDDQVEKLTTIIVNPLENGIPSWMVNRQRDPETGSDRHLMIGKLSFAQQNDIKRLIKMKCYRGDRHRRKLPVRGQRTSSNFRNKKGSVKKR